MSEALAHNTPAAVAFLKDRGSKATLSALWIDAAGKKGLFETATFKLFEQAGVEAVTKWIETRQGTANQYYEVNTPRQAAPNDKKHELKDLAALRSLHVDLDPRQGESQEDALPRIVKQLNALKQPPTWIIASGGGVQGIWDLVEPVPINGDEAVAEDLKLYNVQLERELGGDNCHNVDRIMRLPGTINIPDERKLKKGRKPALAYIVKRNETAHRIGDFKKADPGRPEKAATTIKPARAEHVPTVDTANVTRITQEQFETWGLPPLAVQVAINGDDIEKLKRECAAAGIALSPAITVSLSEPHFYFLCECARKGISDQDMFAIITDDSGLYGVAAHVFSKGPKAYVGYALRQIARAIDRVKDAIEEEKESPILDENHTERAEFYVKLRRPNLKRYKNEFYDWNAGRYDSIDDEDMKADLWRFHRDSRCYVTKGTGKNAKTTVQQKGSPDRKLVAEAEAALKAITIVSSQIETPSWLGREGPPPHHLISFPNGLLDIRDGKLLEPTPAFFTPYACAFPYDAGAGEATEWRRFTEQIFQGEHDKAQVESLQEAMGYIVSSDNSLEKGFNLIGPTRSGKDTIKNVIMSLLAPNSIVGPTLQSLGTTFGLSMLINKGLAIIGDSRIGPKADVDIIVENLLKIIGRGIFTFDRKHKSWWTGYLPVKILNISNEPLKLRDDSAAIAGRFVNFRTRVSYADRADLDPHLFREKLLPERQAILKWSLDGLRRIRERSGFPYIKESPVSQEERKDIAINASQALAFMGECLDVGPDFRADKDEAFTRYRNWCAVNGQFAKGKGQFLSSLYTASGGRISQIRARAGDERIQGIKGCRVRTWDCGDAGAFGSGSAQGDGRGQ